MYALRRHKSTSSLLLLASLLTIINVHLISLDAHDDDQGRVVGGIVAIVGGVATAASEAADGNVPGFVAGVAAAGYGVYLLFSGSDSSSSGSNDVSGGTSSMQPAPPETSPTGQTTYH